jgi:hypothetical protein
MSRDVRHRAPGAFSDASLVIGLTACFLITGTCGAWGQDPSVDEVVRQVRAQDDALDDETAEVVIRSLDAGGGEKHSTHRLYWKNPRGAKGLLGQTLLVARSPLNRRGESFLLWQAERAGDSQAWLYLPELRQALRVTIAGQDVQRPKRNSDLHLGFEQLGARLIGAGDRHLVGRDRIDGAEYLVIEERSVDEPASTRRFWVSATNWTIGKIEYRDAAGRTEQTQSMEWQQVDRAWVWKRVEIRVTDPPGHTIVELRDAAVNTGLSDRLFTVHTLKSGTIP